MKKILFLPLALMFVIMMFSVASPIVIATPLDRIVAIVNNEIITASELEQYKKYLLLKFNDSRNIPEASILNKQILNQMILNNLQLQLAKNAGIDVEPQEITDMIKEMAKDEGYTLEQLNHLLQKKGISTALFRKYVKQELLIERVRYREVISGVVVSNSDIEGFLNSPVGQDQSGVEYKLQHMLIANPNNPNPQSVNDVKQKAEKIVADLKAGGDFTKIAMTNSSDQHALHGGYWSWKKIGEVPTLLVKYVASMNIKDIVGPIKGTNGFHIIKLVDKRTNKIKPYVEIHARQILIQPGVHISDKEAKANLLKLRAQILKGKDFSIVAEKKSEELTTATNGGDMGWLNEKSVLPEFYRKLKKLKKGEISQPFKTELGWHLVQVLDIRSHDKSLDAARNQVKNILKINKYQEVLDAWLRRLRDDAKIEILL